jgi:predicted small metal-binding protein
MKRLACRDIGLDCDYIIKGETEEEIMTAVYTYSLLYFIFY